MSIELIYKTKDREALRWWRELEAERAAVMERGVYETEYPAGAAYGPMPYSDAAPILDLSKIPGWPGEQS